MITAKGGKEGSRMVLPIFSVYLPTFKFALAAFMTGSFCTARSYILLIVSDQDDWIKIKRHIKRVMNLVIWLPFLLLLFTWLS